MHHFPQYQTKRLCWIKALALNEDNVSNHHRVCSRHFAEGDAKSHHPQLNLGKRFASPKKQWTAWAKRATRREEARNVFTGIADSCSETNDSETVDKHLLLVTQVGEQLETKYEVHELPTDESCQHPVMHCLLFLPCLPQTMARRLSLTKHCFWELNFLRQKTRTWSQSYQKLKQRVSPWKTWLEMTTWHRRRNRAGTGGTCPPWLLGGGGTKTSCTALRKIRARFALAIAL